MTAPQSLPHAGGIVNIAACLPEAAAAQPDTTAIHYPHGREAGGRLRYRRISYRALDEQSDDIARGLESVGIGRGVRTVLMVKPGRDFFAIAFAMAKAGVVPVMVDPGMGARALKACIAEAGPEAFIGIPTAHAARLTLGWGRRTIRHTVTVGGLGAFGGHTLAALEQRGRRLGQSGRGPVLADTRADEIAAILFTSGSTGIPKGVIYTHANFDAQIRILRGLAHGRPGDVDLPTFPLFALFDPALKMTTVIPDMDFVHPARVDGARIVEAINRFAVTNMFASPAVLTRVADYGVAAGVRMPSLVRVISAGAPVPPAVIERFLTLMPAGGRIVTPYGATEALPVTAIDSAEILGDTRPRSEAGAGICVGRPVDEMSVSIIPISDEPLPRWQPALALPPGQVGEIVVHGPTVTPAYLNRPRETALAKIQGDDGRVHHRMGDVGYLDEGGRLWFCGRKAQRITLADRTLFTAQIEGIFNAHPAVFRSALVGVERDGRLTPVLCVELRAGHPPTAREQVRRELRAMAAAHAETRPIDTVLFHTGFPTDARHNSKIRHEDLASWAASQV